MNFIFEGFRPIINLAVSCPDRLNKMAVNTSQYIQIRSVRALSRGCTLGFSLLLRCPVLELRLQRNFPEHTR